VGVMVFMSVAPVGWWWAGLLRRRQIFYRFDVVTGVTTPWRVIQTLWATSTRSPSFCCVARPSAFNFEIMSSIPSKKMPCCAAKREVLVVDAVLIRSVRLVMFSPRSRCEMPRAKPRRWCGNRQRPDQPKRRLQSEVRCSQICEYSYLRSCSCRCRLSECLLCSYYNLLSNLSTSNC